MDISQAIAELDELIQLLERDGDAVVTYDDIPFLAKALAALESCKELGGR